MSIQHNPTSLAQAKAAIRSRAAVILLLALSIAIPAIATEWVARAFGSGFMQGWFATGAVMIAGYIGGALLLLLYDSWLGIWTRTRLAISTLLPAGVFVMAELQPMDMNTYGFLLIAGAIVCLPLLWVSMSEIIHGNAQGQRFADQLLSGHGLAVLGSMLWSAACIFLSLTLVAEFLDIGAEAGAVAAAFLAVGGAELLLIPWYGLLFVSGALEEIGRAMALTVPADYYERDRSHSDLFDEDSFSRKEEDDDDWIGINPATGLMMIGAVDVAGNLYGTDSLGSFETDSYDMGTDPFSSFDSDYSCSSMFD